MAPPSVVVKVVAGSETANETAEQAYERNAKNIVAYAQRLGVALGGHLGSDTVNWGHVGDLAHVGDLLQQAVEFLEGEKDE